MSKLKSEIVFQFISPKDDDKVKNNISVLMNLGFEIFDLRGGEYRRF